MDPEIVAALIGPVLTALLAGTALGLKEWRSRQLREDRRQETLEQAASEVAFIDAWITTHAKLASAEAHRERSVRALSDLERSYEVMATAYREAAQAPKPRTTLDRLGRVLLLRLQRPGAKVVRVFYFIFLALGFLFTWAGISQGLSPGESLGFTILVGMTFTLLSFIPAIGLYVLARLLDRPKRERRTGTGPMPSGDSGPMSYGSLPGYGYSPPGSMPAPPSAPYWPSEQQPPAR